MERYEVFVSERWPEPLKESDFDPNKYKKDEYNIGSNWACFLFFITELFWFLFGKYVLATAFTSFENIWIVYVSGFILFPIIIIYIINNIAVSSKTSSIAYMDRQSAMRSREYKAERLSDELNGILSRSQVIVKNLPAYLSDASRYLRIAEQEFNESAFSPFWDQIEKATRSLSEFYDDIKQLCQNGKEYTSKLYGKIHNFPVFIYDLEAEKINPAPVVSELNRIVRKGQTNFQFATIFEQKRTQKILIMGFRNLGDAINNLSYSMESAMSELTSSLSDDMQRVSRSIADDFGRLQDQSDDHFRRQSKISDDRFKISNEQLKRQSKLLTEQLHNAEHTKDNLEKIARKLKAY